MSAVTPPAPGSASDSGAAPWWRHGYVWLVIAGPLGVVLASVVTLVLAGAGG